jgi:dTDP-6-deoxy-L-talose 4-dehydrogenase (NAD+)
MRILVTGANGFVGNHVINYLLNKGFSVIASSRNISKAKEYNWFHSVKFIPFDFYTDFENISLYNYFEQPDILIHLAWDGLPNFNNSIHIDRNLFSQYKFLTNFIDSGGKHVLITGTCFEYGLQNGCLSEEMPTNPVTAYGIAKDALRKFLEIRYPENCAFIFQWVRLFYMYGDGQHPKSIISQLANAIKNGNPVFNMSGGEQTRDYLPVETVAENICKIALQDNVRGIINCSSGNPISIRQLVENYIKSNFATIKLNLGFYSYPEYEPMHFWGETKKIASVVPDPNILFSHNFKSG